MVSLFYTLSFAASLVSSVAAHGTVMGLEINGKSYRATDVNRGNRNQNPLHRTSGDSLICNTGGKTSTKSSAKANPGDEVTFQWEWTTDRHPGPIETELAFCGDDDGSCNGFSATGDVWFKIQETGVLEDSTGFDGGNWASDKLKKDSNTWKITLPQGLKKGAYLMRHNIVAMHLVKKPEFYPSCTHLVVGGSGTGVPSSSELFAIPGYLSDPDSQKALDFNIFSRYKKDQFKLAGPRPVESFSDSGPDPVDPTTTEADPTSTETDPVTTEGPASTTTVTMTRTQKGTKTAAAPTPTETVDDLPECPEDPDVPEDDYSSSAPASASAAPTASPTEDLPPCPSSTEVPEDDEHDEYKRDYTESLASGVNAVRQVLRRMNSRHGKRRIAEWH